MLLASAMAPADAARPTDAEAIARVEQALGEPLATAPPTAVGAAVGDVVRRLSPEEIQYSIDIVGAVARAARPQTVAAAAAAARAAVADAATADPGAVEDWWAELIDDSIAMVAGVDEAATKASPDGAAAGPGDEPPATGPAAGAPAPERSAERPLARSEAAAGRDFAATDLALSTDRLTAITEPEDGEDAKDADDGDRLNVAAPPDDGAPAGAADGDPPAAEAVAAIGEPAPAAAAPAGARARPPDGVGASEAVGPESNRTETAAAAQPAVDERPPDRTETAAEPPPEPEGVRVAGLPVPPPASSDADLVVSRMLGPSRPDAPAPRADRVPGDAPDVPLALDEMLESFDGIVQLVEFWLQKPIERASTIELARAVQATILMLPPDALRAASAVAGATAAVVATPQAVRAITRAAEAGVQVKASQHPGAITPDELDLVLAAIGRATGNLAAIRPAAGGFGPTPGRAFGGQGIDGGS